ncbi:MAG: TetR/AcrR family transcriptional regulator [Planctomycetota bacterium]
MARRREHDQEAARAGAVEAFRRSGYAATSLAELEEATGLDRRQLYNAYEDKRGVFIKALEDFSSMAAARFLEPLEASAADLDVIKSTLHAMVEMAGSDSGRLGCLICNTAREPIASSDAEVRDLVQHYFDRIERAYANALKRACSSKQLTLTSARRRQAARHLMATHVALCVLARAGSPTELLRDAAAAALSTLQ